MKLTNAQTQVILLLAQNPLVKKFYWTGGTLLAYHYLQHRNSLDIDLFSDETFSFNEVNALAQQIKLQAGFKNVSSKKIFDRWEFIFENSEILRVEFVHFNYGKKTLRKRETLMGIHIDSIEDLAANKTLAYFDRNEPKDLYDLYFLLTKKKFTVDILISFVQKKFGVTFAESLFWSEAFKIFPYMHTLRPLILDKTEKEQEELLTSIEQYFRQKSAFYLKEQLD